MLLTNKIKQSEECITNKTLGFRKFLETLRQSRCYPLSALRPSSQSIHESEPLPEHERPSEGNRSEVLHYDRSDQELEKSLNGLSSGIPSKLAVGDHAIKNKLRVGAANRQKANSFRLPSYCFEPTKVELGDHLREVKKGVPKMLMEANVRGRPQRLDQLEQMMELKGSSGQEQITKISVLNPSLVLKYCRIHQLTSASSLKEVLVFFTRLLELVNFTMPEPKIQRYKNCVYYGQPIRKNQIYQGIVYYYSGIVYFGELYNNQRNGLGVEIDFAKNDIYKGEFRDGEMVGSFQVFKDGQKYLGELYDGKYHGRGILIKGDEIFEGQFREGKKVYGSTLKQSGRNDMNLSRTYRKSRQFWSNQKSSNNSRTQRFQFSNNQVREVRSKISSYLQLQQLAKKKSRRRYVEQPRDFSFPLNNQLQGAFNPQKRDITNSKQKQRMASMRIREIGKLQSSQPIAQQQMEDPLINKF